MRVDPPTHPQPQTQAHAKSAAPPEETEPEVHPPGASDTPDQEEPALGTYDDGGFEPL